MKPPFALSITGCTLPARPVAHRLRAEAARLPPAVERRDSIILMSYKHSRAAVAHPADYPNAHVRHWQDAEFLFNAKRWANADQLYGLSAECGLKAVMVADGLPVDAAGSPRDRRYKEHVNILWNIFHTFVQGRPTGKLLHHLPQSNPFKSWCVANRYANDAHFDRTTVTLHRDAAQQVRDFYLLRLKVLGHV